MWSCWADSNRRPHPYQLYTACFCLLAAVVSCCPAALLYQGIRGFCVVSYRCLLCLEKCCFLMPAWVLYGFFGEAHTARPHPLFVAFLTASRMIWAAWLTLSALAWVYIRSVTALSLWPSASETLATSAPLVIATLAKVWRSLWG